MMRVQAFDPYALAYRSSLLQVATPASETGCLATDECWYALHRHASA